MAGISLRSKPGCRSLDRGGSAGIAPSPKAREVSLHAVVGSFTISGIEAVPVAVEVSAVPGYPQTTIVGLPDTAVRESRERIFAAFRHAQVPIPPVRLTINLAPAEMRKEGTAFDLPIALGILGALGHIERARLAEVAVAGELALDGTIRSIRGVLPMALACRERGAGKAGFMVPAGNADEAREVDGVPVLATSSLAESVAMLVGTVPADARDSATNDVSGPNGAADPRTPAEAAGARTRSPRMDTTTKRETSEPALAVDLATITGQTIGRRALEIAAAGGHNLLLVGPPGAGKTLLARALAGILPPLGDRESLEVTAIHSVAGLLRPGVARLHARPFRAPHHTVTAAGLAGGGLIPRPGEVTLAHRGVLFLDELPEFRPAVVELLRQPLEEGTVRIVRAGRAVQFPSRIMLVAAMNPCPCGMSGHPVRPCRCTPMQVRGYQGRVSGPLIDRMDLHVEVPAMSAHEVAASTVIDAERSSAVRARVEAARSIQHERFVDCEHILCNSQMTMEQIDTFCALGPRMRAFLERIVDSLALSARAVHRSLRVARTIADLEGVEDVTREHVAEAMQYRWFDRQREEVL